MPLSPAAPTAGSGAVDLMPCRELTSSGLAAIELLWRGCCVEDAQNEQARSCHKRAALAASKLGLHTEPMNKQAD